MTTLKTILTVLAITLSLHASAQVEDAGGVRRATGKEGTTSGAVAGKMLSLPSPAKTHDADLKYMREIYRRLDLSKGTNAALCYPEEATDGNENLFRIILRLVADGTVPAYEYLDGKEVFTDRYRIKPGEMLERFGIYAQPAKGSTEKNPKFIVDEADVPVTQVSDYYIIERWEFDRRSNRMKTRVEAICPVLNRMGDFGTEARYPMFWVRTDALRPYLAAQYVFLSDDNNVPRYSLDDYFTLGLYEGEIYKTRNLRNLSMAQMYPDEDDRRRAQDSIDNRLRTYGKDLWVPTREEYLAMKEKEAAVADGADTIPERTVVTAGGEDKGSSSRVARKSTKKKKSSVKRSSRPAKVSSSSGSSSRSAAKSVRRRKR